MSENHVVLALFILCIVGLKPSFILGDTDASDSEFYSSSASPSLFPPQKVSIFSCFFFLSNPLFCVSLIGDSGFYVFHPQSSKLSVHKTPL